MKQKHVLAVHDISCMGRCSLTVALPVISAAGIITSIMPTAVLSTHTGEGFAGYTYRDLTADMLPIADHWGALFAADNPPASFDAIYTGYLGSKEQLEIVKELVRRFKSGLIIIDPVMADHGRLYKGFAPDYPQGMSELCKCADVITPNMTEALLMLGQPYQEGPYSQEYIIKIITALGKERKVVLTGVYFSEGQSGAAAYDNGEVHFSFERRVPGSYHGTGDLFASVLTAALVSGNSINRATDVAVKFTAASVLRTYQAKSDVRYGVNFEAGLSELVNWLA